MLGDCQRNIHLCTRPHTAAPFITVTCSRAEPRRHASSSPALILNVSNNNDRLLGIYMSALLKGLAGVMKLAVSEGRSSLTKALLGGGGQIGLKSVWSVLCVCAPTLDGALGMK